MSFDLSANKIELPAVGRIKDAVIEIVAKHNDNVDAVQADLNELQEDVYGILGYNVTLSDSAKNGDSTLNINDAQYATVGAKFTVEGDDTTYKITAIDGATITIDPTIGEDLDKDTVLHIKSKIDPEEIYNVFDQIQSILNGDSSENNVFGALVEIANQWNAVVKVADSFEYTYDSNDNVDIDLSGYGFGSADDYNIMISCNSDVPAVFKVLKKDEKTATIVPRDLRYFAEDAVAYDGSCDDCSAQVTILVTYNRTPISFTLTDLNGNTRGV